MNGKICALFVMSACANLLCSEKSQSHKTYIMREIQWINTMKHRGFDGFMDEDSLGVVNLYLDRIDTEMLYARRDGNYQHYAALKHVKEEIESRRIKTMSEVKECLEALLKRQSP